jgi:diacylglycerol kinase family enzyme
MKKALLIYNPSSGRRRERRVQQVAKALTIFQSAGIEAESCATTHSGSAVSQTQAAVSAGFDTVIACGGDGTANEVLNGLMMSGSEAALGILPFGSGNVLATNLLLPTRIEAAARTLLTYQPRALHPGLMLYREETGMRQRYLIIVAGVGSDAELMYRTLAGSKERYGVYAYFLEMMRMAVRRRLPMFKTEWKDEQGELHSAQVAMVMALRAKSFPGLLRRVRMDVELTRNQYRLILFRTNKVRHFLNYFGSVMSGMNWNVPQIQLASSQWFRCTPLGFGSKSSESEAAEFHSNDENSIRSEADGELLGKLPVEVSIAPKTFNLLMKAEEH